MSAKILRRPNSDQQPTVRPFRPIPIAEFEMKASFFCTNSYLSLEPYMHRGWPTPPRWSKSDVTVQSAEYAFEQAQTADELGFDWVACSEHHYLPALQTP